MGLSHAQYDGFSLATIWNDLRSAYLGVLAEPTESRGYHRFIQHALELSNEKTDAFWRELLRDSTLTIVSDMPSVQQPVMSQSFMRTIPFQFKKSGPTNYGTLLKAAWALALSAISQSTDVAFWNLVSGRFAPFEGAQAVVGPCINFVPVRVRFDPNEPVSELLRGIHEQHVACIPLEATPTNRIIQQAEWPASSTSLGTVFQYQNIPDPQEHPVEAGTAWTIKGGAVYGGGLLQAGACWLLAWPTRDGHSSFRFTFSPQTLSPAAAESIVALYLSLLRAINDGPQHTVASVMPPANNPSPSRLAPEQRASTCTLPEIAYAGQSVLTQIETFWKGLLGILHSIGPDESFFDLGGDSLLATELEGLCVKAGFNMTLQDILDFPTLRLQALLVSSQISRPAHIVPQLQYHPASELS
ncbi:condensation domain-containing protein [Hirsutella rhossiliensis]